MNICVFTRSTLVHSLGGMEVHADLLSKGLAKSGHRVSIITTAHPAGILEDFSDGVNIFYLPKTRPGKYSKEWQQFSTRKFFELNRQQKFDLVCSESGGAFSFLAKRLNKKLKIPAILIMHGIFYNELKTRLNLGFSLKNILAVAYYIFVYFFRDLLYIPRADAVIATSQKQNKLIRRFYFLPERKVFTVYNGIDTALDSPDKALKEKLGFNHQDKIILCVARLKKEKGIHILIASLPLILKNITEAKLLLVGDGEYSQNLKVLVTELNLGDKVKFAGSVPFAQLGNFFHLADVFVNSTIRENGYDLTIIQAMAYGKTVVATNLNSLQGVIESGDNGFLVPLGGVRELAQVVTMILENARLRQVVGGRGQIKVRKFFSAESMVNNTLKVFKQCLSKKPNTV